MFLEPIDFAKMYKEHKQKSVFKRKSSDEWDKKSKEMAPRMQKSHYVEDFISKMEIDKDDVVLDVGCGPGTLAIPLAKKVKRVIAIDFSRKMLDELESFAEAEGITNITTYHMGWDDDWSEIEAVDIVVASRSIEVLDIEAALLKISNLARKACYVSYMAGGSFVDMKILDYIDKTIVTKPDFWYLPIILYKEGYLPKVDYIPTSSGSVRYTDEDEFVKSLIWSLGSLNEVQQQKAREYYELYIKDAPGAPKDSVWAFVSWNCDIKRG
ncbi:hypothetical protein M947_04975 [Sulfurimonas hongkongensis]|uniref:Methyltransferase domain-containing protein n=1 Tax=Sulfurimonas hongkongensis TaxID=1172190 RepID=T0L2A2_9BACT|nr:class I SAM-dependent methyltransferase [Sulfurimonas hongkongensis]EQB39938.1 hypothetical protein M947_04975 [Sulfurimonas hongkongensis]